MSYPKHLIQSVLEDCQPVVICTKEAYNHLLNTSITSTLFIQDDWVNTYREEISRLESKPINRENVLLDDMAYTVYSSGTTGKPSKFLLISSISCSKNFLSY